MPAKVGNRIQQNTMHRAMTGAMFGRATVLFAFFDADVLCRHCTTRSLSICKARSQQRSHWCTSATNYGCQMLPRAY